MNTNHTPWEHNPEDAAAARDARRPAKHRRTLASDTRRFLAAIRPAVRVLVVVILVAAAVLVMGLDDPARSTPLAPCATEDATGPCRWDARTQGNGEGRSFTVTSTGAVIYDRA